MAKKPNFVTAVLTDNEGLPIPWSIGIYCGSFETKDDNNNKSPLSLTETVIEIKSPDNAATIVFKVDKAIRISERQDMNRHFVLMANETLSLNIVKMDKIYLRADSVSATVNFLFQML